MDVIPYVSISPGKISCYSRLHNFNSVRSDRQIENEKNLSQNDTSGEISKKARKKITAGIDWLLYLAKEKKVYSEKMKSYFNFKVMFVTLTLSSVQMHSDNFIKSEMLNQFLIESRKKWKTGKYIWRAEAQKNGNIHFHIVFDKYIPWQWIQKVWNRIQDKYNYVAVYSKNQHAKYKNGFFFNSKHSYGLSYSKQKSQYHKGVSCGWYKPNSTDVHSVQEIRNLSSYLAKYCTKNDEISYQAKVSGSDKSYYEIDKSLGTRQIEGRLWGLSQSLSQLKSAIEIIDNEISAELSTLCELYPNRVRTFEYCTVIYLDYTALCPYDSFALLSLLADYYTSYREN